MQKEALEMVSAAGQRSFRKKALIRAASIVLALVADALFIYFVTGLNPLSVYAVMFNGTFSTTMRFMWAMRDLASLLLIGIALAPAFKMRFWNVGAEGQVLMGALATAAVMVYYGGKVPNAVGIPEEQLRKAAKSAVCKINIDSDSRLAMTAAIRQVFAEKPGEFDPRKYLGPARDNMKKQYEHKIVEVLGSDNKLANLD